MNSQIKLILSILFIYAGTSIYAADSTLFKKLKPGINLTELGEIIDKENASNDYSWDNNYAVAIKHFVKKSFTIMNTGKKTLDIIVNVCENNDKIFNFMYYIRSNKESLEIAKAYEYIVAELLVNPKLHKTRRANNYAKNKEDYTRGGGLSFYVGKEYIEIGIFNINNEMVLQIDRYNEDVCKS